MRASRGGGVGRGNAAKDAAALPGKLGCAPPPLGVLIWPFNA